MNIASQARHFLTFLAGLGGLFLAWQIIAPDQVATVNEAGAALIDPLVVIIGAVAAGVARLVIGWVSSFFSRGAEGNRKSMNGPSLWMVGLISTAAALGGLPSCNFPDNNPDLWSALRAVPITIGVTSDDADVRYSSKGGLVVSAKIRPQVNRRSSK